MERRVGLRARTDFHVITVNGSFTGTCRGIEVSPMGIVLDRGRMMLPRDLPLWIRLEMRLPERVIPLRALARNVWTYGSQQALHFVDISDVDRLTLAEHLDLLCLRGEALN